MSKPRAALAHAADGDTRLRKRFTFPALRKLAAAATAVVLGAGLAVVGVAAPASAHTGDLKAKAVCNVETGEYDVTYTLKLTNVPKGNSGSTMWRVGDGRFDGTPTSAARMDRGPEASAGNTTITLGTESLPGDTVGAGPWVYAFTTWSPDNFSKGSDGRVEGLTGDCGDAPNTKKLTICHATASATNPYERITIAYSAVVNAHIKHQHNEDVIPAFTYKGTSYPAQGDQDLLLTGDCSKPKPVEIPVKGAPTFQDTCGPDNEKLTVPADTNKIDWEFVEQAGVITVTATAKPGYVFKPGQQTVWTFTIDDEPCPPTVIPVGGEPSYTDTCGPDNEQLTVPKSTARVEWTSVEVNGTHVVTATPGEGYAFPADAQTEWVFPIDDSDCVIPVVGAPTFQDTCGADNEQLTVPESTSTIKWTKSEADGIITVTAAPLGHNVFPADAQTVWTFTIDDAPCVIEVQGAPTFEDVCGPGNEQLTLPDDTDAIDWESVREGDVITVTATAKGGSVFPEGAQVSWTFTVDDLPCLIELEGEPTFSDICGPDNETVSYPENTELISWSHAEVDGKLVVTAKAAEGNTFAQGPVAVWSFPLDDEPCITPVLEGSVATGICEADAPWISYKVTLTDPDRQVSAEHRTVSLVLSDGEHVETIELGELNDEGVLDDRVLWPGASVDADGNATGWPGWKQLADGTWVETDDNFAWTRDITSAKFVVNPELQVELAYPPATPDCIAAPPVPGTPGEPGGETPSTPAGDGLASTGFAGTTFAIVAGVVVLAGIAFIVIARLRRKQS